MLIKKHITGDKRLILAVCDDSLLGNLYQDGKKQIDLTADFYKGEKADEDIISGLMAKAFAIHAVGKDSVACCVKAGLASKDDAIIIKGVPCLQLVLF